MAKNEQLREVNQPVWFDGKSINEALFCDDFLSRHKIIYTNGAFFTPDGRVTDELPLRGEIFEELKCCAVSNIPPQNQQHCGADEAGRAGRGFPAGNRPHPSGKWDANAGWYFYRRESGNRALPPAGGLQSRCAHADPLAGFSGWASLPGGHPNLAGVHRLLSDSQQQGTADDGH